MNQRFINVPGDITIRGTDYSIKSIQSVDCTFDTSYPNYTMSGSSQTRRPIPAVATLTIKVEIDSENKEFHKNSISYDYDDPSGLGVGSRGIYVFCPTLTIDVKDGPQFDRTCAWSGRVSSADVAARVRENERQVSGPPPMSIGMAALQDVVRGAAQRNGFAENQLIEEAAKEHVRTCHGAMIVPHPDPKKALKQFVLVRLEIPKTIQLTQAQAKLVEKIVGRVKPGNDKTRTDIEAILSALKERGGL